MRSCVGDVQPNGLAVEIHHRPATIGRLQDSVVCEGYYETGMPMAYGAARLAQPRQAVTVGLRREAVGGNQFKLEVKRLAATGHLHDDRVARLVPGEELIDFLGPLIGWPSIFSITSPTLMLPRSAGIPGVTDCTSVFFDCWSIITPTICAVPQQQRGGIGDRACSDAYHAQPQHVVGAGDEPTAKRGESESDQTTGTRSAASTFNSTRSRSPPLYNRSGHLWPPTLQKMLPYTSLQLVRMYPSWRTLAPKHRRFSVTKH